MKITTEYITLGQLLKFSGIAHSGGDIKYILNSSDITVNDTKETRRGRKLYPNDIVIIDNQTIVIKHDS